VSTGGTIDRAGNDVLWPLSPLTESLRPMESVLSFNSRLHRTPQNVISNIIFLRNVLIPAADEAGMPSSEDRRL
jgi:hypothetical protein